MAADTANKHADVPDYSTVDGEVVVSLNVGATHITTACLQRRDGYFAPIPLIQAEGNEPYQSYMRDILQQVPIPWCCTSPRKAVVDGLEVDGEAHFTNQLTEAMFKDTFMQIINTLEAKLSMPVQLGIIACPHNFSDMTGANTWSILRQVKRCVLNRGQHSQSLAMATWPFSMSRMLTSRASEIKRLGGETKDPGYFVTVAIFPNFVQILFDAGQGMTDCEVVKDMRTDQDGHWTHLAEFRSAFTEGFQKHIRGEIDDGPDFDPFVVSGRVVVGGEVQTAAAEQLAAAITDVAPFLQGKIQGVDNPTFITAMRGACLTYCWHYAKPRPPCPLEDGTWVSYLPPDHPSYRPLPGTTSTTQD